MDYLPLVVWHEGAEVSLPLVVWFLVVGAGVMLWILISPRSVWHATAAWRSHNAEANEPSSDRYAMQRLGAAVGLIFIIVIAVQIPQWQREKEQRQNEQRQGERQYLECKMDPRTPEHLCNPPQRP